MMGRRPLVLGCALGLALSALSAHGGALEDFQTAIVRDNDRAIVNLLLRGMDPNTVDAQGQPALVKALRLECSLVVGARGVGKSFWTQALASAELQDTALCCSQEEPQATATGSSVPRITAL